MQLLKELLALVNEGKHVVKSKDGVERRFTPGPGGDLSPEAKAWKETTAKKPKKEKVAKYSQEWWEDQDDDVVLPWDKIEHDDDGQIDKVLKDASGMRAPDDWSISRRYEKKVDGVVVAGVVIRAGWMITKDDDLGTGDEPVENYENFGIVRDSKNPKKFKFDGYK